jgi:hypothetical protein
MADNQIVKVVFDFDLGNVPASTKAFTKYMESVGLAIKPTKASADALAASYNQLAIAQTKAGNSAAAAGNQIKKSNMQWTNFALVLQDLPYGFRGIQNNLPALMGGFAGLTGPIYLAGSALIAFFTAWDNGMIKFGNTVKLATDFSKEAATAYSNETIQLESLYRVTTDANVSMDERLIAAQALKKEYPGLLGLYSDEDIALGKADKSYQDLTKTIWEYAQVKAAEKTLEELAIKQNDLTVKKNKALATQKEREANLFKEVKSLTLDQMTFTQRFVKMLDDLPKGPLMMVRAYESLDRGKQNLIGLEEEQKSLNDETKIFKNIIDDNITAIEKLNGYTEDGETGKKVKNTYLLDSLKAKQQAYKDDIYLFRTYGLLIINEEEKLAVARAKEDGTYLQNKKDIHDRYEADRLTNNNLFEEKLNTILELNAKKRTAIEEKELEIQANNRLDIAHAILAINKQFAKDDEKINNDILKSAKRVYEQQLNDANEYYQNKLNFATGNLKEQLAILKEEQLAYDLMYGFRLVGDDDYAKKSGEITKSKIQKEKALIKESFDSLMQLGNGIMSALGPSLDMLLNKSASIGDVLKSAFNDLLKQLIKVTLAAAIAVALIAIIFPGKLATAGGGAKLFGGLFGQGMGLGKDLFGSSTPAVPVVPPAKPTANGGIFGGPSFRLVGEYPGAQSNPEIVAPLDKLKSLIGGGGGTLEARISGNDLLILMNKAQRNNNLSF